MCNLRLALLVVLTGFLVGCGPKEDDSAPKDTKKTDTKSEVKKGTPAVDPPAVDPPAVDPPAVDPPAVDPPAVDPPAVDPPAVDPPAVDPPAVDPPAVDPPAVDPPAVDPPAVDPPAVADRVLDSAKAQKREVRHSMIGFRNTLLFYAFKDQQAVLTLSIGNKDETFPVKGRLYLFDDATTEEGLNKWINNQHSDGLYPDVPSPIVTEELPEETCKVTSHKQTGTSENPTSPEIYKNYEVELSVKEHVVDKKAKLSAFTDTATVHVKSE
jgi:hypothetical protein